MDLADHVALRWTHNGSNPLVSEDYRRRWFRTEMGCPRILIQSRDLRTHVYLGNHDMEVLIRVIVRS